MEDESSGIRQSILAGAVERGCGAVRALSGLAGEFDRAVGILVDCLRSGGKVMACGNGGSATDAEHFMTELLCRYKDDRPSLAGISLTSDGSFLTATANDYGYEHVFSRQVEGLGRPGDVLVGITTSGNSESVNAAVRRAGEMDLRTIALLGRDGGPAKGLADVDLIVPVEETAGVQEAHTVLIHALCEAIEKDLLAG